MSNVEDSSETEVLKVHEGWQYLRSSSSVGRLALIGSAGPEVFPGELVVLEADGLNPCGMIAWSVVVKGAPRRCHLTREPEKYVAP